MFNCSRKSLLYAVSCVEVFTSVEHVGMGMRSSDHGCEKNDQSGLIYMTIFHFFLNLVFGE